MSERPISELFFEAETPVVILFDREGTTAHAGVVEDIGTPVETAEAEVGSEPELEDVPMRRRNRLNIDRGNVPDIGRPIKFFKPYHRGLDSGPTQKRRPN